MKKTRQTRGRKKGGKVRHPGLCADAQALGVTPEHLSLCLDGVRTSKILLGRYAQLKSAQTENAT